LQILWLPIVTYCYDNILTGIDKVNEEKPEVKVFPNPNNGIFNLEFKTQNSKFGTVEIYNMLGEKIYSNTLNIEHSTFNIDISNHSAGIYLYRVLSENGNVIATGKIAMQ